MLVSIGKISALRRRFLATVPAGPISLLWRLLRRARSMRSLLLKVPRDRGYCRPDHPMRPVRGRSTP